MIENDDRIPPPVDGPLPPLDLAEAAFEQFGLTLTAGQTTQFDTYYTLLQEWNQKLNLTRIVTPRQVQIRHFLDSLSCATQTGDLNGQQVVDVGTGAGFPGVPLKILYPQMGLTLVDSVAKKGQFLTAVAETLGLSEVQVVAARAEELGQDKQYRGRFDWVMARSVAELRVLVEYLLPLAKIHGRVLAQKGESAEAELINSARAIKLLGGGQPTLHPIRLPEREQTHYLVIIPKTKPTPATYPRRPGLPSKKPLE